MRFETCLTRQRGGETSVGTRLEVGPVGGLESGLERSLSDSSVLGLSKGSEVEGGRSGRESLVSFLGGREVIIANNILDRV
jgi:hypothetical protein